MDNDTYAPGPHGLNCNAPWNGMDGTAESDNDFAYADYCEEDGPISDCEGRPPFVVREYDEDINGDPRQVWRIYDRNDDPIEEFYLKSEAAERAAVMNGESLTTRPCSNHSGPSCVNCDGSGSVLA